MFKRLSVWLMAAAIIAGSLALGMTGPGTALAAGLGLFATTVEFLENLQQDGALRNRMFGAPRCWAVCGNKNIGEASSTDR